MFVFQRSSHQMEVGSNLFGYFGPSGRRLGALFPRVKSSLLRFERGACSPFFCLFVCLGAGRGTRFEVGLEESQKPTDLERNRELVPRQDNPMAAEFLTTMSGQLQSLQQVIEQVPSA